MLQLQYRLLRFFDRHLLLLKYLCQLIYHKRLQHRPFGDSVVVYGNILKGTRHDALVLFRKHNNLQQHMIRAVIWL